MEAPKENNGKQWVGFALYVPAIIWIAYQVTQRDFIPLMVFYTIAFAGWVLLLKYNTGQRFLTGVLLITQIPLIFAFPALSDDVYRFYWDGRLWWEGISPYGLLPVDVDDRNIASLSADIFNKLNSPEYYTVYPPGAQLYFFISAFRPDVNIFSISLKILFLLTEFMGLFFLNRIAGKHRVMQFAPVLFFLNPLVVIEGLGNLHFEFVMISFLAGAIWYFMDEKWFRSSLFFIAACAIKLLPLMLLPFIFFRLTPKIRQYAWGLLCIMTVLFIGIFYSHPPLQAFFDSLDLYFRKFEFNASIYFLLRTLGTWITGYNMIAVIGPLLAFITLAANIWYAFKVRKKELYSSFFNYSVMVWSLFLFCSTTVHPWYIMPLVFWGLFTNYCFAIVWSFTVILSYAFYFKDAKQVWLYLLAFEYILVFLYLLIELQKRKLILSSRSKR
jgi:alpha-1,6-mannosyltransferase